MQILAQPSDPHQNAHTTAAQPASLRIVAVGDSLIYGFGDPEGGGWVERLRRRWMSPESPSHALYGLGVRGDRVRQVARRLEGEFRNRGELRHRVPDIVILSVGLNDSARLGRRTGKNFTDFDEFRGDLANLLDQAQQLCPVLFVGMTPVDEAKMPFSNCLYYNHADQHRYKEATRLACQERQIPYLDIFERWLHRGESWYRACLTQDGLHPNSAGYAAILQDVLQWDAVQPWIGE
ncbi:MAG: G-D-S-L family lipolytic protein [Cyanobacteria bacterium RM1_2_2]|nr:G-D-S-L family lipolytic protein [Cyanobacteria bacterium RM1_2_2]